MKKLYAALTAAALAASGTVVLAMPAAAAQEVHYANCDAVRAAGKDPLYRGDPGYRAALDRDNDGIACEKRGGSGGSSSGSTKSRSGDSSSSSKSDSNKSTSKSYSQIGDDDVPAGGVAAGGG